MISSFLAVITSNGLRGAAASRIRQQLPTKLPVELVDPLASFWVDQEIGQCPDQRVHTIGRGTRRRDLEVSAGIGNKGTHLIFESRERSEVVHPALLIECGYRFRPRYLSP
jgi:hypothetical protein